MKFVLAGYFGFGNFGDEAILKYAVDILRYYYKEAEINVITQNPQVIKKNFGLCGIKRFDFKKINSAIKNSDFLIFPGGSVLQDVTSIKSILYYLFLIYLASFYKKKIIMIAQGIGPINNVLAQKLTAKILRKVSFISVRDEKSKTILDENSIESELTADLLWAFTEKQVSKEDEQSLVLGEISNLIEKQKVGLQIRKWNSLTDEKLEIIARSVLRAFPELEFDYKLICLQKNSDEEILIKLGEIMHSMWPESQIEICIPDSIESSVEVLQSMDYMLAMRFHAGLCTINAEKPLLMLSYDPKTEEFCKELGLEFLDVRNIAEKTLAEKIQWLKEFNPVKTALKTNIMVKKARQNVDFLIGEIDR